MYTTLRQSGPSEQTKLSTASSEGASQACGDKRYSSIEVAIFLEYEKHAVNLGNATKAILAKSHLLAVTHREPRDVVVQS